MSAIYLEGKPIAGSSGTLGHLYLVYVDNNGNEFVLRGGPSLATGLIVVEDGIPLAASSDARGSDTPTDRGRQLVEIGDRDAFDVWQAMSQHVQNIGDAGITYLIQQNSNSVVNSALHSVGLELPEHLPRDNLWGYPGYDNLLGIDTWTNEIIDYDLVGTGRKDILAGINGADTLESSNGDDILFGYGGDDTINSNLSNLGSDTIVGGLGIDTIKGSSGTDYIWGDSLEDTTADLSSFSGALNAFDAASASYKSDVETGESGGDLISAGDGTDYVFGGDGDDTINGGSIYAADPERAIDDGSRDYLYGDYGADTFVIGIENYTLQDDYVLANSNTRWNPGGRNSNSHDNKFRDAIDTSLWVNLDVISDFQPGDSIEINSYLNFMETIYPSFFTAAFDDLAGNAEADPETWEFQEPLNSIRHFGDLGYAKQVGNDAYFFEVTREFEVGMHYTPTFLIKDFDIWSIG